METQENQTNPTWNYYQPPPANPPQLQAPPVYYPPNFNYFPPPLPPPNFWPMMPPPPMPPNPPNFSNSNNIPNTQISTFASQRENDQDWAKNWCEKLKKPSRLHHRSISKLTIPDVKSMLQEALFILQELSRLKVQLEDTISSGNDALWSYRRQRVLQMKSRLEKIQTQLSSKDLEIKRKLERIKKKRFRISRRNEDYKQEKKEKKIQREELHKKLDAWLERLLEKDKQILKERELKEEADKILSEVRKKQVESKKALDLIQSLDKLRQLRKQAAERKGLFTTKESDNVFMEKTCNLISMLEKQLIDYEAEEKALRVMLDKDAEQKEEENLQKKVNTVQNETLKLLFGETDPPDRSNPIFPFWFYYTQSERSLDALLCIRQEWDSHVVNNTTEETSGVPVQWVIPEGPSSEKWTKYIVNDN